VIPTADALEAARQAGLDLVLVAPDAEPPVCKIMDFGKHKYEQDKKQRASSSKQQKTKEIRLRPGTGDHDIETKVRNAIGFLSKGMKVVLTVQFRGREMARQQAGLLTEHGEPEGKPSMNGRRLSVKLSPVACSSD